MARVAINPLSLAFDVPEVEAKYSSQRSQYLHLLSDKSLLYVSAPLLGCFLASELGGQVDPSSVAIGLVSLSTYVLQWFLMKSRGPYGWEQRRTHYVTLFRIFRLFIAVVGFLQWKAEALVDSTALLKVLILRSGVLCNVWFAVGMPLLFKKHIFVQICSSVVLLLLPGRAVCQEAHGSAVGRDLVLSSWQEVDNFFQVFTQGIAPSTMPEALTGCFQLVGFVHIIVGLVIPSFFLWQMELQSRREYGKVLGLEGGQAYALDETWVPDPGRTLILLCMSIATLWMLVNQFSN